MRQCRESARLSDGIRIPIGVGRAYRVSADGRAVASFPVPSAPRDQRPHRTPPARDRGSGCGSACRVGRVGRRWSARGARGSAVSVPAVGPEAAVGHEQVQVRMPVGPRAMRLQTGNDANRELTLAGQRANRGRDGAGGDAGDLAEQATTVQTVARSRMGMVRPTWRCGTGARSVVSSHCVQIAGRLGRATRSSSGTCTRRRGGTRARRRRTVVAADAGEAVLQHAAGAGSAIGAPSHRSAEHTLDLGAYRHRSVARRAVTTPHRRGGGLTMLAADGRCRKRAPR